MKVDSFCRLCGTLLHPSGHVMMFHIMPVELRLKIFKIIPFKISMDDMLPKECCYKCIDKLKTFLEFVDKSWKTQRTFHRRASLEKNKSCPAHELYPQEYRKDWYEDDTPPEEKLTETAVTTAVTEQETHVESLKLEVDTASVCSSQSSSQGNYRKRKFRRKNPFLAPNKKRIKIKRDGKREKSKQETRTGSSSEGRRLAVKKSEETRKREAERGVLSERGVEGVKEKESEENRGEETGVHSDEDKKSGDKIRDRKTKDEICDRQNEEKRFERSSIKKRRQTEAEILAADNLEHFNAEVMPACGQFCQLFVNGELTLVEKPFHFKSNSFIMCSIPEVGFIYACTKCDDMFTTDVAAKDHQCYTSTNSSDTGTSTQYVCQICDLSFPRRAALEAHLTSHLTCDLSDEEIIPTKRRRIRRRVSSDLELSEDDLVREKTSARQKKTKDFVSDTDSESESDRYSSDNFIVDDDVVIYDDDFIVQDEEALNRRRLKKDKSRSKRKRRNSGNTRAKYLFS